MNLPSRRMAARRSPRTVGMTSLIVISAAVGAVIVLAALANPIVALLFAPCAVLYGTFIVKHQRSVTRLRRERSEESICEFSRSLPARDHDTWVVRAVYEEVSSNRGIPIRPADRLHDLGFADDDIEMCVENAAHRADRSLVETAANGWNHRVQTVADLIAFLEHQPKA
jgi:hypothetical protein